MFLGYQNDKIALIADTEAELTNNRFMKFDRIEESADDYVLYNGEYITASEAETRQAEDAKQAQRAELLAQLDTLDLKTIRSMRAIQAGTATADDREKLSEIEAQAEEVRQQLKAL